MWLLVGCTPLQSRPGRHVRATALRLLTPPSLAQSRSARQINNRSTARITPPHFICIFMNGAARSRAAKAPPPTPDACSIFKSKRGAAEERKRRRRLSIDAPHNNAELQHARYFFAERLPAPFLGGPLPLRFKRSALLCQYLQRQSARASAEREHGWGAHSRAGSRYSASSFSGVMYLHMHVTP